MSFKKKSLSLLSLLMALVLVATLFAGCRTRDPLDEEDPGPQPPEVIEGIERDPEVITIESIVLDFAFEIEEKYKINDHTVGWVYVPNTNISGVVVRNPECRDNLYYLRRDINREFYFDGIYYIDFRADLGLTREYLGVNTCIYGHAMSDDPTAQAFNVMFGNLHKFRDPDFMRENPYIFFSLPEDNMVFEIIAVFYGNVGNPRFSYNDNPENPEDFINVINDTVLPRSLFHFDVELSPTDRFLTLSTCIYNAGDPPGSVNLLSYRNTWYRFAIMARLLDPDTPLLEYASFVINEERIIDEDGRGGWVE